MKKCIVTTVLICAAVHLFAQEDIGRSAWVSSPVKIDGSATEWNMPLRYYDSDAKLFFAFANDDKNIYLCFQTDDNTQQRRIMRAGMKITLSSKGNGKHKVSISYPLAPEKNTDKPDSNSMGQTPGRSGTQHAFSAARTQMEVKGFLTKDGLIPVNDSSGIHVALNLDDSRRLTYEIAIPLKEFFGEGYTAADIEKNISLDAELNSIASSGKDGGNSAYSGRSGGRSGGGKTDGGGSWSGGGGRGGGGNHFRKESNGDNNVTQENTVNTSMPTKSSIKEKFVLATANNQP